MRKDYDASGDGLRPTITIARTEADKAYTVQLLGAHAQIVMVTAPINPDGSLVPGLFARVRGAVGDPSPRLLVPERAVGSDQQGRYVLVVNDKNVVEYRTVTPGIKFEGMRVVEQGLKGDEWVVVNGLLRARAGAKVDPQRGDALAFVAAPAKQAAPDADRAALLDLERAVATHPEFAVLADLGTSLHVIATRA